MTAIVGAPTNANATQTRLAGLDYQRSSMLPDGAAGVFAPGWDTSFDRNEVSGVEDVLHLAAYGLGSPFPEDAKLCAALSSYWPAVAPDIARVVEPNARYASATPLTDEAIGLDGSIPWDGINGPRIVEGRCRVIEYSSISYGDYVRTSLENGFNVAKIGNITPKEYIARTVVMARAYQALGATTTDEKVQFAVFSFMRADLESDPDYSEAVTATGRSLDPTNTFRVVAFRPGEPIESGEVPFDKVWVTYDRLRVLYADPHTVLEKEEDGCWKPHRFND